MNDPREIQLGFDHYIDALKSVRHIEHQGYRGFFLSILAGKLVGLRNSHHAFCCCFSLEGDQLPLWNEYTGYQGLSIGFRPTALKDIQARIQKVEYINENTPEAFRRKVLEIASAFDPDGQDRNDQFWIEASVSAFAAITALKHATWSYEREVRMVFLQTVDEPADDNDKIIKPDGEVYEWLKPLERIISNEGKVKYLAFPFGRYRDGDAKHKWAIKKIIIGPKCKMDRTEVQALLDAHGFDGVQIEQSNCQIR